MDVSIHVKYLHSLDSDDASHQLSQHLKLNAVYWASTSLEIISGNNDHPDSLLDRSKLLLFVKACLHHECGGFAGNIGHDPHLLYTLSAIQILASLDAIDEVLDVPKTVSYIASLQNKEDGSFHGDEWGEVDVRYTYCAVSALSLLKSLHVIDTRQAVSYLMRCQNSDGGYGSVPDAESHGALVWCCVGALCILDSLECVDSERLCAWLCQRQVGSGGLNGRPEKLEDVCYSWWYSSIITPFRILASLKILGKEDWIDCARLKAFILSCQDLESGGFADRPDDEPDVFHTLFGLAALSVLGHDGLKPVDPRYCMRLELIEKMQLT